MALLSLPHGRVHFAGAERGSWPQFVEGAAESGEETAKRVLEKKRPEKSGTAGSRCSRK